MEGIFASAFTRYKETASQGIRKFIWAVIKGIDIAKMQQRSRSGSSTTCSITVGKQASYRDVRGYNGAGLRYFPIFEETLEDETLLVSISSTSLSLS